MLARVNFGQAHSIINHGLQLNCLTARFTAFYKLADPAVDLSGALRLRRGFFKRRDQCCHIRVSGLDHRHDPHAVVRNRSQGLIEFVCQ